MCFETIQESQNRVRDYQGQLRDLENRLQDAQAHGHGEEIPILEERIAHKQNCVAAAKAYECKNLCFIFSAMLVPPLMLVPMKKYKEPEIPRTLVMDRGDYRRVFLSHTGQDKDAAAFASLVREALHKARIDSFLDSRNIAAGDPWEGVIEGNARNCQVFVVILSPNYFRRYWCLHELDLAISSNRKVVPVCHSCKPPKNVDEQMKRQLREVLIKKKRSQADFDEVEHWYENVEKLKLFQGVYNYSTHKHGVTQFRDAVVAEIRRALRDVQL